MLFTVTFSDEIFKGKFEVLLLKVTTLVTL